jgi:hypothetical protein
MPDEPSHEKSQPMSRSTQGIGSATELCGQDNFCTDRVPDGVEGRARLRELSGFDGCRRCYRLGRSYVVKVSTLALDFVSN